MNAEVLRRRNLPHWDVPDAAYFVTTCLEGSIPAQGLLEIRELREEWERRARPKNVKEHEWKISVWKKHFMAMESWLDGKPANRLLETADVAAIVVNSLRHFAEERYELHAFVVMPSHIHWVFEPKSDWVATLDMTDKRTPRERIIHSLNSFTASRCNKCLDTAGPFWQHESYDHWVRDVEELERIIRYIEENPVKAGLARSAEEFPFSSAFIRKQVGLEWGQPIPQTRTKTWRQGSSLADQ